MNLVSETIVYHSKFKIGQRVYIDDDHSIKAWVTGVLFRGQHQEVEVSWVANGVHQQVWIPAFRLSIIV